MKFLAERLRDLVQADSRNGKQIADAGGFSPGSLSQWQNEERTPGANELGLLAEVFGVPVAYFYDESPQVMREATSEIAIDGIVTQVEELRAKAEAVEHAVKKLKASSRAPSVGRGVVERAEKLYAQKHRRGS